MLYGPFQFTMANLLHPVFFTLDLDFSPVYSESRHHIQITEVVSLLAQVSQLMTYNDTTIQQLDNSTIRK